MALTPSNMVELGSKAPDFQIPDVNTGRDLSRSELSGDKGLLVMFICNHCPFVKHLEAALIELAQDYAGRGIDMVAISANDVETHPDDSPEKMAEKRYPFPYLYDETQAVAKAFNAACTPDFFLFDRHHKLVYRGQFDDSRPGNDRPVTGADLRAAMDAVLAGKQPSPDQTPSMGCNIKWKT